MLTEEQISKLKDLGLSKADIEKLCDKNQVEKEMFLRGINSYKRQIYNGQISEIDYDSIWKQLMDMFK